MTNSIYEVIRPETYGIPELSVGLAIWIPKSDPANCEKGELLFKRIADSLNNQLPDLWQLAASEDSRNRLIFHIFTRRSLIDIHKQAGEDDWDDVVVDFFHTSCKSILPEIKVNEADLVTIIE